MSKKPCQLISCAKVGYVFPIVPWVISCWVGSGNFDFGNQSEPMCSLISDSMNHRLFPNTQHIESFLTPFGRQPNSFPDFSRKNEFGLKAPEFDKCLAAVAHYLEIYQEVNGMLQHKNVYLVIVKIRDNEGFSDENLVSSLNPNQEENLFHESELFESNTLSLQSKFIFFSILFFVITRFYHFVNCCVFFLSKINFLKNILSLKIQRRKEKKEGNLQHPSSCEYASCIILLWLVLLRVRVRTRGLASGLAYDSSFRLVAVPQDRRWRTSTSVSRKNGTPNRGESSTRCHPSGSTTFAA